MKNDKIKGPEAVRVRFAPSPTGYLHIGSARTAFFNWLFAKKTKGKFILRIEDTDISRHLEETIELITDSLKWLGITWDEGPDIGGSYGPYRQSQRKEIYIEYAQNLISEGKAYHCFCSPEKLSDKKKAGAYKYDRECLNLDKKSIRAKLNKGVPFTIRLLVPDNLKIDFTDSVYGQINVESINMEDFIIIRSNGLPTYNFSVSIDDILMEITNVIRGEDHLSNTPRQVLVYHALNKDLPVFTHVPMIIGSDGQKLSKRHGSISIEAYRQEGFLPEAIKNYMALLGWSYDEKSTIFSLQGLISKFSLEQINKKPSRFDYEKLLWLNGHYIRQASLKKLEKMLLPVTSKIAAPTDREGRDILKKKLARIILLIRERIKTLIEAGEIIKPFFDGITYNEKIINYTADRKSEAQPVIYGAIKSLSNIKNFNAAGIEISLRKLSEELEIGFRKTAEFIRIAVWGDLISPPLFETMEILGRQTTLQRLKSFKSILNHYLNTTYPQ